MVNVGMIVTNPLFASHYTVIRRFGKWERGRLKLDEETRMEYYGAVQPAADKELKQLPEGDSHAGSMKFYARAPRDFLLADESGEGRLVNLSDEIIWRGGRYKVFAVKDWRRHGYVAAFAHPLPDRQGD